MPQSKWFEEHQKRKKMKPQQACLETSRWCTLKGREHPLTPAPDWAHFSDGEERFQLPPNQPRTHWIEMWRLVTHMTTGAYEGAERSQWGLCGHRSQAWSKGSRRAASGWDSGARRTFPRWPSSSGTLWNLLLFQHWLFFLSNTGPARERCLWALAFVGQPLVSGAPGG